MEKFVQRLKTDMKLAVRTVKSAWRTYFALFVAVFLIQMLFGIIGFARENSLGSERETILAKYDSHVELTHLNNSDYYYLLESYSAKLEPYFEVIPYGVEKNYFTVGILFKGNPQAALTAFCTEFAPMFEENGTLYTKTPLYHFDTAGAGDSVRHGVLLAFVGAISFALLTILTNIRINHYKFTYGIYMSFGADFKRLVYSTLCETMFIFLLTYLPAMAFSFLVVALLSLAAGGSVYFALSPLLWAFVVPCIATILATVVPVRYLTTRRPSQVMLAEDNSNRVSSPRRSRMIFATRFPHIPELLSLFRFSGYGMKLVLSGTLFSLLFTCGIYVVSYYNSTLYQPSAQYTVHLYEPDDNLVSKIDDLPGLTILNGESIEATEVYSHTLFASESVLADGEFMTYPYNKSMSATHRIVYRPADDGLPAALGKHYGYAYIGDPSLVVTEKDHVIVSNSIASQKVLDIKPGDTVYVALYGGASERFDANAIYSSEDLLRVQLENFTFTYRAFTVAAVITNEPSFEEISLYLPADTYAELTGKENLTWSVYADASMSDSEFESTDKALRSLMIENGGGSLQDHEARTLRQLSLSHNYTAVYTVVFLLVLLLLPLIWFFSLLLFNEKRKGELDVYRALGAEANQIRKLFWLDGIVYSAVATVVYAILSPLATGYLQKVLTSEVFYIFFLPSYADKPVYLTKFADSWTYVAGIVLTAASALLASYVSYRIYRKRQSEHISENFAEED